MFVFAAAFSLQFFVLQWPRHHWFEWVFGIFLLTSLGLLIALIVGVTFLVRRHLARSRRQAMAVFAADHGWQFHPRAHADLLRVTDGFRGVYTSAWNPYIENVVSRTRNGVTVALFDFCYRWKRRLRRRSVACVWSDTLQMPYFALRQTRVVDQMFTCLGGQDINVDEHPAFSERYRLRGEDEAAVRKFFSPDLLDFFAMRDSLREYDIMVEGENNCLMLHPCTRFTLPPAALTWLIEETEAVFRAILCLQRIRSRAEHGG
jgi:hypothetical protein